MAGKGEVIIIAAVLAAILAGFRKGGKAGPDIPGFGEITFRQDAVMGAAVNKAPGDSFTITGSFTYMGPANSVTVVGRIYKGSTIIKNISTLVSVPQSSSFVTYSFSMFGTIPINLNGDLLDGDVKATESSSGRSITSARQSGVYFIPVQEDLGGFGPIFFAQVHGKKFGRVSRR